MKWHEIGAIPDRVLKNSARRSGAVLFRVLGYYLVLTLVTPHEPELTTTVTRTARRSSVIRQRQDRDFLAPHMSPT